MPRLNIIIPFWRLTQWVNTENKIFQNAMYLPYLKCVVLHFKIYSVFLLRSGYLDAHHMRRVDYPAAYPIVPTVRHSSMEVDAHHFQWVDYPAAYPSSIPQQHTLAGYPSSISQQHTTAAYPGRKPREHTMAVYPCSIPWQCNPAAYPGRVPWQHTLAGYPGSIP